MSCAACQRAMSLYPDIDFARAYICASLHTVNVADLTDMFTKLGYTQDEAAKVVEGLVEEQTLYLNAKKELICASR